MAHAGATLAAVGDPTATRTVYVTIAILISLGVAMALLAAWVFRRTRPEPELLAPLEAMESRTWRRLDPATQRRLLDEARPPGAVPLTRQPSVPKLDKDFSTIAPVASFDDLADDDFDDAFGIGVGSDGPSTKSTPILDLLDEDIGLPEHVDPVVAVAEPDASEMAGLEIDDPVAAGSVAGARIDRLTADDFGNELEFPSASDAEHDDEFDDEGFDDEGFADEMASELAADPLITRRGRADSDRR